MSHLVLVLFGVVIGVAASFTGLGGGFLMVPALIALGFSAQKAVGTSFAAIIMIALSALLAHNKLQNIDWRTAILLGVEGILGAQLGPYLLQMVSTEQFRRLFALILIGFAFYLFLQKQ